MAADALDVLVPVLAFALLAAYGAFLHLVVSGTYSVHHLAHALSVIVALSCVGLVVESQVSDEALEALVGGWGDVWSSAAAVGAAAALLGYRLWLCGCDCCCRHARRLDVAGAHPECRRARLATAAGLAAACSLVAWGAMAMRINSRLRASALAPRGGSLHWRVARSAPLLAGAVLAGLAASWLHWVLKHALHAEMARARQADEAAAARRRREAEASAAARRDFAQKQQDRLSSSSVAAAAPPPSTQSTVRRRRPSRSADLTVTPSERRRVQQQARAWASTQERNLLARVARSQSGSPSGLAPPAADLQRSVSLGAQAFATPSPRPGDVSHLISSDSESDDRPLPRSQPQALPPAPQITAPPSSDDDSDGGAASAREWEAYQQANASPVVNGSGGGSGGGFGGGAAADWQELWDDANGCTYYYNEATGESQWERPY